MPFSTKYSPKLVNKSVDFNKHGQDKATCDDNHAWEPRGGATLVRRPSQFSCEQAAATSTSNCEKGEKKTCNGAMINCAKFKVWK